MNIPANVDPRLAKIAEAFNPDCIMHDELMKLKIAIRAIRNEGVECFGIHDYVQAKERAMRCRLEGRIESALYHEARCDEIYKTFPEWARW